MKKVIKFYKYKAECTVYNQLYRKKRGRATIFLFLQEFDRKKAYNYDKEVK